jgi:hypothetical protein
MGKICQKLLENSLSAALSSIEIYNKPDFKYREEIFTILNVNSWELLLKAKILKGAGDDVTALYVLKDGNPKLNRNGHPLTVEILGAMRLTGLDPVIAENLTSLVEIRDSAVHFYNSEALSYLVYTLGVASLRNYQKLIKTWFDRSLTEYNFYILPLAFAYNFKTLSMIDCDKEPEAVAQLLKTVSAKQTSLPNGSEFHLVCEVSAEIRAAKKFVEDGPDITIGVISNDDASSAVVVKVQRLTDRYPISYYEMLDRVRGGAPGVKQGEIDKAIRELSIKGNPKFSAYNFRTRTQEEKHKNSGVLPSGIACIYNDDAVRLLIQTLSADRNNAIPA